MRKQYKHYHPYMNLSTLLIIFIHALSPENFLSLTQKWQQSKDNNNTDTAFVL